MNSPIQGTAADIMKLAMIAVDRELREKHLRPALCYRFTMSFWWRPHRDEAEQVVQILTDRMKHAAAFKSIPWEVEAHTGDNWLDAK